MSASDLKIHPSKPTIKDIIQKYGFQASKKLGQNFLLDPNIPKKIVLAANLSPDDTAVEIGPGPGALTHHLLESPAAKILLIEKDPQFISYLQTLLQSYPNASIENADALRFPWETLGAFTVVANLPYNIGTELLIQWLELPKIPTMAIMLQKEVVDRLVAQPRTKSYGRLSILSQWLCKIEKICDVPPTCFWPAPKVVSTVVKLTPHPAPLYPAPREALEKLTQAVFQQRRKMLRNTLAASLPEGLESNLLSIGIKPTQRPEELSIKDFCKLATLISEKAV
jgi:16S rRNA (adenine1518-N6/adenine1519-N6)-dimethyltransferase